MLSESKKNWSIRCKIVKLFRLIMFKKNIKEDIQLMKSLADAKVKLFKLA